MPRYADFAYGSGETYGVTIRATSASFLTATTLDYGRVRVKIEAQARTGLGYILVRSRSGTVEDPSGGIIVASGNVPVAPLTIIDGEANFADNATDNDVRLPWGFVYYTLFVFESTGRWFKDAATSVLVAQDMGTWRQVLDWIPRVFTSSDQNPLSEPDLDGDLARFLHAFAVTYDELSTFLQLTLPDHIRHSSIRRLHDAAAESVGMPSEYTIGVRATSRLRRDAGVLFTKKGTLSGIAAYVESLTGWDSTAHNSPNMLLALDDASFETLGSVGNWTASGGTITRQSVNGSTVTGPTPPYEDAVQPYGHAGVARVTLTSSLATATLPGSLSRELSVPVTAATTYYYTAYVRAITSTPSVALNVAWLSSEGTVISTSTQSASASTSSWSRRSLTATAPAGAHFARLIVKVSGSSGDALDLDLVQFASSDVAYQDPRLVTVVCTPTRINLISDPGFDLTTEWSATTGTLTRSSERVHLGTYAGKAVGGTFRARSESIPVIGGYSYSLAGYASRLTAAGTASTGIDWFSASGGLISSSTVAFDPLTTTSWTRVDLTDTAPTNAASARVVLAGTGTVYFDSYMLERTDRPQVYFDSNTADYADEDGKLAIVGTKRYHLLYPNRFVKLTRLIATLPYYLPQGVRGRVVFWDSLDPSVQAVVPYGG